MGFYNKDEFETTVSFLKIDDKAVVYTSDKTAMKKFDSCVKNGEWEEIKRDVCGDEIISKTYSCPKNLINFRKKSVKQMLSDEEINARRERLAKARTYKP